MRGTLRDSESLRVPLTDAPAADAPTEPDNQLHTAADAPNHRGTQPYPNPDTKPPLRFGGACQGIFPALTSTPEPSGQSNFGVPHATPSPEGERSRQDCRTSLVEISK
ncbi:hypothetical protein GCM10009565_10800 [Amycolatopsis albidoflavus]